MSGPPPIHFGVIDVELIDWSECIDAYGDRRVEGDAVKASTGEMIQGRVWFTGPAWLDATDIVRRTVAERS